MRDSYYGGMKETKRVGYRSYSIDHVINGCTHVLYHTNKHIRVYSIRLRRDTETLSAVECPSELVSSHILYILITTADFAQKCGESLNDIPQEFVKSLCTWLTENHSFINDKRPIEFW